MDNYKVDVELLITLVSDRPVLWDKSLEEFKSRTETAAAWREVFKELNPDFEELSDEEKNKFGKSIIAKWTNVRDRQVKYLRKLEKGKGTGSKAVSIKKYIYSDQLGFLQKNTKRNFTISSMDNENTESNDKESEMDVEDTGYSQFSRPRSPQCVQQRKKRKSDMTAVEKSILEKLQEPEDRHMNFFKGILPSLKTFDESETIQFQVEVLNVLQRMHQSRSNRASAQWSEHRHSNDYLINRTEQRFPFRPSQRPPLQNYGPQRFSPAQVRMPSPKVVRYTSDNYPQLDGLQHPNVVSSQAMNTSASPSADNVTPNSNLSYESLLIQNVGSVFKVKTV